MTSRNEGRRHRQGQLVVTVLILFMTKATQLQLPSVLRVIVEVIVRRHNSVDTFVLFSFVEDVTILPYLKKNCNLLTKLVA